MIVIDAKRCIGCGECEKACGFGAMSVADGLARVDTNACTLCGACIAACPEEAITLEGPRQAKETSPSDLSAWQGIWVAAEWRPSRGIAPITYELLGTARGLAAKQGTRVTAVLLGFGVTDHAQDLIRHGADCCIVVDHPELAVFTDEVYGNVLADLARTHKPAVILAGATPMGRSYIPRVATLLEAGLTADCTGLDIREEDGALLQTRPAWGGNLMATIVCEGHRPQMATVRPNVFKPLELDPERTGEILFVQPKAELLRHRVTVIETIAEEQEGPALQGARVVITAGRGIESKENIALVERLASLLGGAVGSTRAVTDAGWLPERTQIGQTGVTVSPKLYIGCGVSGAIQHVVGMQGSEIVVAINRDPSAPIFDVATYGIVGDVKEILPLLIKRIGSERG